MSDASAEAGEKTSGRILVLQHEPSAPPGGVAEVLDGRSGRRPWQLVDLEHEPVPPLTPDVDGVIVLGSEAGVIGDHRPPTLDEEVALVQEALAAGVPLLGICFGSQLLAVAAGGEVTRREVPEIGFPPLSRTDDGRADPVSAGWPDGASSLMMHEDFVTRLPEGAVPLLSGSDEVAMWRLGERAYGVQTHPEAGPDILEAWLTAPTGPPFLARAGVDPEQLLDEARRREAFTRAVGWALIGRFVDKVIARDDPAPRKRRPAAG